MTNDRIAGVVLIGMAGAGKTVVGRELARLLERPFVDTDTLMENMFDGSLQTLLERAGPEGFKRLEQFAILHGQWLPGAVVATGGSVIYSQPAVATLRQQGPLVYLRVSLSTVQKRVGNWDQRGFIRRPGQSLADVYAEREPLYAAAADLIVPADEQAPAAIAAALAAQLERQAGH